MPVHKVTKFLSEISTFFKKSDSDPAMFTIMDVIKGIKMNEQALFGRKSRCNSKWKSRACLTPEGKAMLTPENFFILTPLKS